MHTIAPVHQRRFTRRAAFLIGAFVVPCLAPNWTIAQIEAGDDDQHRRPTAAEYLAREGFADDDQGLAAAAASENFIARILAFRIAGDRQRDLLTEPAIANLQCAELAVRVSAARYLAAIARPEGITALQAIIALPESEQYSPPSNQIYVIEAAQELALHGDARGANVLLQAIHHPSHYYTSKAAIALGAFRIESHSSVQLAWVALAEQLDRAIQSSEPEDSLTAVAIAQAVDQASRSQLTVTQQIKDAFDAIVIPPNRAEQLVRVAASLDSAKAHWATCELVPSEAPPPSEPPPADPPPSDPE